MSKKQPIPMTMGDGGMAAFFGLHWTKREVATWMILNRELMTQVRNRQPGIRYGIRYVAFNRGFHDKTQALLLYSKEVWMPLTIAGKCIYEQTYWRHFSISFHSFDIIRDPEHYGHMRLPTSADLDQVDQWIETFFGTQRRQLLCEPPVREKGIAADVWHYRLLVGPDWLPAKVTRDIPESEFAEAGWISYSRSCARRWKSASIYSRATV